MARILPTAVIWDLDGVLCDNSQELHDYIMENPNTVDTVEYWQEWFDGIGFHEPSPHWTLLAQMLSDAGHQSIILTGRPVTTRLATLEWLDYHEVNYDHLCMSPGGNGNFHGSKESHLVELMKNFSIKLAFDDSEHWCDLYRRYGIPTIHVHTGLVSVV